MASWELVEHWGYVILPDGRRACRDTLKDWIRLHGLSDVRMWGGNFAFVALDERAKTQALVTDACATVPLHWSDRPVFCHPDVEIVRDQARDKAVDHEFVEASLDPARTVTDRTPFRGVRAVPPGCMVFLRPDGAHRTLRYFSPASLRPHRIPAWDAVNLMRAALHRAVADAVHAQVVAAHLSGGLDSGVVTALAQQMTSIVSSYSWIGPGYGDEYTPVAVTAGALGLDPVITEYGDPPSEWLAETDPLLYPAWGMLLYESVTLPLAARAGATTILSGWGGDDFASSGANQPEVFLAGGHWGDLVRHGRAKARRKGVSTLRAMTLHRIGQRKRGNHRFPRRPSHLLDWRQDLISWRTTTWWKAATRFGLSYRYPLLDPRVVRLACQLPPSFFAREGLLRWGFRQIAAELLPGEVAFRTTKLEAERVRRLHESTRVADEVERAHRWYPELDDVYAHWAACSEQRRREGASRRKGELVRG